MPVDTGSRESLTARRLLLARAIRHPCFSHPLFACLNAGGLTVRESTALLRNYDVHASVLRRLLLKAAAIMPEPAVGFVLENVRNEYGNGSFANNHQSQLQDIAWSIGASRLEYFAQPIEPGVRSYIKQVGAFYLPDNLRSPPGLLRPAIAAGAITATELLAVKEFKSMQRAFAPLGLAHHRWFHHVLIEEEHSDESLALALYFIEQRGALEAVQYGLDGILDASCSLYDGLLSALKAFKTSD